MAQTIGIVCARRADIYPFTAIHTHIRLDDQVGSASLFQAELKRCADLQTMVTDSRGPVLIIIDELFNSTNPEDGVQAARTFCESVAKCPGAILVIATHFKGLTELAAREKGSCIKRAFMNFRTKITSDPSDNSSCNFTYKIENGISTVRNAIDLANRDLFRVNS